MKLRSCLFPFFFILLCDAPPAHAQVVNPYILNGNAYQENCNCYTLTGDANNQSGSVWNKNKIDLRESFDYTFNIYLGCNDAQGADGIAFVLQPIGTSIGTLGGGIGFEGVSPSVGILIDTWQNSENNDPVADHIAIHKNGNINHSSSNAAPMSVLATGGNIEDCAWHVLRIKWDATTGLLSTEVDGVERVKETIDMVTDIFFNDPLVYWGFTAATGGGTNRQRMCTSLNPSFYLPENQKTCYPEPIQFIDSSQSFGTIEKWFWDFDDGTFSDVSDPGVHVFPAPGNYNVKLSILGNDGCVSDTMIKTIVVGSVPKAGFVLQPLEICKGYPVHFIDSSSVEYGTVQSWQWKIAGQSYTTQYPGPIVLNAGETDIELSVQTKEGCNSALKKSTVTTRSLPCPEFYVPSAFTPNNDGKNDRFSFAAPGLASIDCKIYNRYGQLIYRSSDMRNGWNGMYKNKEQSSGTYVWVLNGTDLNGVKHARKGIVLLIR